ncbi:MAG: 50S ribosomal protein L16 [DPANN group archaeon]|nr:50S ribosomal protein L16 [DPANN group archaeon]
MGLRPAHTLRGLLRSWSRTARKKQRKAFIRGVPDSRIRKYDLGSPTKLSEFSMQYNLMPNVTILARDNSLEAARTFSNKVFEKKILKENYYYKMRLFPHEVIREHTMASGAGADRLSTGMRLSFGKVKGRAARLRPGTPVASIYTDEKHDKVAREGLARAARKLPGTFRIEVKPNKNYVPTPAA